MLDGPSRAEKSEAHLVIPSPQRRARLWKERQDERVCGAGDFFRHSELLMYYISAETTHSSQVTKERTPTSRKPAAGLRCILRAAGRRSEQPQTRRRMVQGFNS